jgi:phosphinothricin acetyltransferase
LPDTILTEPVVRAARSGDAPGVIRLYNHYVENTPVTFHVEPLRLDPPDPWIQAFADRGRHRLFVAEAEGRVLGFAGSRPFRPKPAYDTTAETTVYLAPDALGRGLGARLYTALFEALAGEDLHRAVAGITLPNAASLALHRRFGFGEVGVYHEVGRKLGRYWDVLWMEKAL